MDEVTYVLIAMFAVDAWNDLEKLKVVVLLQEMKWEKLRVRGCRGAGAKYLNILPRRPVLFRVSVR